MQCSAALTGPTQVPCEIRYRYSRSSPWPAPRLLPYSRKLSNRPASRAAGSARGRLRHKATTAPFKTRPSATSCTPASAAAAVADDESLNGAQTRGSYFFLTNVDVQNPAAWGAVVTLGASITDGVQSSQNANRRWPNYLAKRLADANIPVGVLNLGISGNKLLVDGAGQSALKRFERDVIAQSGVRWVIFSDDPINDLPARVRRGRPPAPQRARHASHRASRAARRLHRPRLRSRRGRRDERR